MTYVLGPETRRQFFDANGVPLVGAKVFYYLSGTTEKIATYKDINGSALNTNPIILDSAGRTPFGVFLSADVQYKEVLAPATDTDPPTSPIYTQDNISGSLIYGIQTVKSFGAMGNGIVDDYPAFAAAIAALPVTGGKIIVPQGIYRLDTTPTWGSKSIYWDIDPAASFTGAGTGKDQFPSMATNGYQQAAGPYIRSQSSNPSPFDGTYYGGIGAFNVEMLQPADYVGYSVGAYIGANGSSPDPDASVWAINSLITALPGAGGYYQCIEVDCNNFSDDAEMIGVAVVTAGDHNGWIGVGSYGQEASGMKWEKAFLANYCIKGLEIGYGVNGLVHGIDINGGLYASNYLITGKQIANGGECILLQRADDSAATGNFLRCVNAANSQVLLDITIDGGIATVANIAAATLSATGNINSNSIITGANLNLSLSANPVASGSISFGSGTNAFVGAAGGAAALPATPLGYLIAYIGATPVKIPYYNE